VREAGWILDVYLDRGGAVLWIKTVDGRAVKLTDGYEPDFYLELKDGVDLEAARDRIIEHPNVSDVLIERKYTSVTKRERSPVLRVHVDSPKSARRVLCDLRQVPEIKRFFNTDILPIQSYLFKRHFAPTSKVEAELDEEKRLLRVTVLDDEREIHPPPFTALAFEIGFQVGKFTPNAAEDPLQRIVIRNEDLEVKDVLESGEVKILEQFERLVKEVDPDILVSPDIIDLDLPYIFRRARKVGCAIQLGREEAELSKFGRVVPHGIKGRVPLKLARYVEMGVCGVVERARFTLAPISMSAAWQAGKTIDARQCYEALKKEILVPSSNMEFFRWITTVRRILARDRGGLILSPKVGVHENVGELDFESEFPNIIVKHNLSYETVTPDRVDEVRRGFLSELTQKIVNRRLYFKHLKRRLPKDSREWRYCDQRTNVLKEILVCTYGYTGCFANRFSNVDLYEEINRFGRECLKTTKGICEARGFEVIYGDTDAIYVKRDGATRKDYEDLCTLVSEQVGLPVALEHHYRFLVLLRQETNPAVEATRRYFGRLTDGEIFYRGIELRRHDYPTFMKEFQLRLIEILLDHQTAEGVKTAGYKSALNHVLETYDKIMSVDVPPEELIVSKTLRKPVSEYSSMVPHVSAAIGAIQHGKRVCSGDTVDFVYVSSDHPNPLRRVMPAEMVNGDHHYVDRGKYGEMLLDVAETILGWNGFTRTRLGIRPKPRDFLEEIQNPLRSDLIRELETLEDERNCG